MRAARMVLPRTWSAVPGLVLCLCLFSAMVQAQQPAGDGFSESVVENVMDKIQNGLTGHDVDLVLSAFDRNRMPDYDAFSGALRSLFDRYESFRVHFQITQWAITRCGSQQCGVATVEFQFEADPIQHGPVLYRNAQVYLTLLPEKENWKIVQFVPRELLQ